MLVFVLVCVNSNKKRITRCRNKAVWKDTNRPMKKQLVKDQWFEIFGFSFSSSFYLFSFYNKTSHNQSSWYPSDMEEMKSLPAFSPLPMEKTALVHSTTEKGNRVSRIAAADESARHRQIENDMLTPSSWRWGPIITMPWEVFLLSIHTWDIIQTPINVLYGIFIM